MPKETTPEEYVAALAAYEAACGNKQKAASSIGVPTSTFKHRLNRAAQLGYCGTDPVIPGFAIKQVSQETDEDGNVKKEWTKQRPLGDEFQVPPGHVIKGVSALTDPSGRKILEWVKTKEDTAQTLETIRTVVDELKKTIPKVKPVKGPKHANALLLNQFTITDLHFGMLAWAEETRDADYDLKIAEKLLLDWFTAAIAMAPSARVAVLAQLGDFMHHDAHESVTPAHRNVLDADSRLQKIIRIVIRVIRQVIAMLLQAHKQVHVIMASANHDPASSAWMRELLHSMYQDEKRITIDNSPDTYYAFEWGKTALFYHHGHRRKIANVDSVFAGKFREMFGRCPKTYGHIGHLHSDEMKEGNLMKIERHRTLAPSDAFASAGGFLSDRDAKVITYHREFGEVSRIILSPEMVSKK